MKAKTIFRKAAVIILSAMLFTACGKEGPQGPAGPQGEQGPKGDKGATGAKGATGTANVRVYSFSITAAQWGQNLHYGDDNVFRAYDIPASEVGGVNIVSFFKSGGVVLAYIKGGGSNGYSDWKLTPHVYSMEVGSSYIGIRIECMPENGTITICKTTNGWDAASIASNELPAKTDVRIVLIEASTFERKKAAINFSNYAEVKAAFHLPD